MLFSCLQSLNHADFGFLFDIDGVIVRGKKLLPFAKDAFRLLLDDNGKFRIPVLFVTNAGNTLRQGKAKALSDWLGIEVRDVTSSFPYFFSIQAVLRENLSLGCPTRSDCVRAVQSQNMSSGLKFLI